jgi:glyoxylase-like metal-dependent hydrolase (beta-lactamase superfamily II)
VTGPEKCRAVLTVIVAAAAASFSATAQAGGPPKPVFEVYAIRYATLTDFPVEGLVAGADPSRRMNIAMTVWLLKGPRGKNVLVDTGFYRVEVLNKWPVRDFIEPSDALGKVGLRARDVTDVIITHMHWDHAGGVELFPGARFWIQRDEWNHYSDPANQKDGIEAADVAALQKVRDEGRLVVVEGDALDVIPGISLYAGGRHTYASQYVGVNTAAGTAVVASDAIYLYENLEKGLPIAQTLDVRANLEAQRKMKALASSPRLIVPGHDPDVFVRFPKPGDGVARIE